MRTIASLLTLLLLAPTIASADDAFYETRLASGKRAYAEKSMPDAATDLRIAAFGFLDRPSLLSETLVWLTLAESSIGRPDMTRWALTRFIEVETRFHPYKELALDAPSRVAFEKVLVSTLSRDTVASVPTLAELVAPAARRVTTPARETVTPGVRPTPPPAEIKPIPAATAAATKIIPTQPATTAPPPAGLQQTGASRLPASSVPPAAAPKKSDGNTGAGSPPTPAGSAEASGAETIAKAKNLLEQNKNDEAMVILSDLVARAPSRIARILLLHAATRSHHWQLAAAQIPFLQPFKGGEEVTMFYAAVALYRTGNLTDARPLLERALPGINTSSYVESYKQKIIGH